jgi:hypothetical protein
MSENLVPAGFYNAVAVAVDTDDGRVWAQFGETKNGTKQVVVTFELLEGAHAGRRLPWFGYFTKDSYERTIESLRLTGFKGDDLATVPFQQLNQKVSVTVEHSEWEGKVRAKIAWVNKPGGGGVKLASPLGKDALRMFAASLKAKVASKPEVAGEKAEGGGAAQSSDVATPPPDPAADDLPF